jgi:hypothetical protein
MVREDEIVRLERGNDSGGSGFLADGGAAPRQAVFGLQSSQSFVMSADQQHRFEQVERAGMAANVVHGVLHGAFGFDWATALPSAEAILQCRFGLGKPAQAGLAKN